MQAYHVGATQVDLAPEAIAAPSGAITLPEHYEDDMDGTGVLMQTQRVVGRYSNEGFVPLEFNEDEEFNLFGGEQATMEGLRSQFDEFDELDEPERLRGEEGVALEPGSALDVNEQLLMTPSREPIPPPGEGDDQEILPMPDMDEPPPMPEVDVDDIMPPSADRSLPAVTPAGTDIDDLPGVTPDSLKRKSPDVEAVAGAGEEAPGPDAPEGRREKRAKLAEKKTRKRMQVDEFLVISKRDMRDALNDTSDIVVERRIPGRKRKAWQRLDEDGEKAILQPTHGNAKIRQLYERCMRTGHGAEKSKSALKENATSAELDEALAVPDMDNYNAMPPEEEDFRYDAMPEMDAPPPPQEEEEEGYLDVPEDAQAHQQLDDDVGGALAHGEDPVDPQSLPSQTLREALAVAADDGNADGLGTAARRQDAGGVNALSTRSRRVANFMKAEFASLGRSRNKSIELKEVLKDGSTKAEAARMLLEMLTLTTKGYMSIKQDASFGSITLKPTQLLSAGSF